MKHTKEVTGKSTIEQLREIRDKIGTEIQDLSYEQLMKYVEQKTKHNPTRVWQKKG